MIPNDLKYTAHHEWLRIDGDEGVVGITDHAQSELGDVVFVELPEVGATFKAGDAFGTIESVKAVDDLFLPVDCEILAVNESLDGAGESVNSSPYDEGWMLKVKITGSLDALLDAEAYQELLKQS